MIALRLFTCAFAMALPLLSGAAPPATSAAREDDGGDKAAATGPAMQTLHATRVLGIGGGGFRSDDEYFMSLQERARELGAEKAGLKEGNLDKWFQSGNYSNGLVITVKLGEIRPPPPPVAAEIADELVQFTRDYAANQQKRELERAMKYVDAAQQRSAEAEQQIKQIRQRLRDLSGRSDISHQTLTNALSAIDEEVQKLKLERLAKESRRRALEEEIAKATKRIETRVESDSIAAELQKVVEAREQSVQQLRRMHESGQASQTEVAEGVAKAAEARARLLQQQRDAAAAAGGSALETFNRELMTLAIDAREIEAKLDYLEERLPALRAAVELLDESVRTENEARDARQNLDQARETMRRIRLHAENEQPPKVLLKESSNELRY